MRNVSNTPGDKLDRDKNYSYQCSMLNAQCSVISYQLSVISYQLSVISYIDVSYIDVSYIDGYGGGNPWRQPATWPWRTEVIALEILGLGLDTE